MACACNSGGSSSPSSFTVTLPNGTKKAYATKIEAQAAIARAGGGTIKPAA